MRDECLWITAAIIVVIITLIAVVRFAGKASRRHPLTPITPPLVPITPPLTPITPPLVPITPVGPHVLPILPPLTPITPLGPHTLPIFPPLTPINPVNPPLVPIMPPLSPVTPPLVPIMPPLSPVTPPLVPIMPPLSPVTPPLVPITPPLSPVTPPLPAAIQEQINAIKRGLPQMQSYVQSITATDFSPCKQPASLFKANVTSPIMKAFTICSAAVRAPPPAIWTNNAVHLKQATSNLLSVAETVLSWLKNSTAPCSTLGLLTAEVEALGLSASAQLSQIDNLVAAIQKAKNN